MTNPYTLTYKFGQALDVGESIAGNHLVRMTMEFTVNDDGTDDEIFSGDVGLRVIDWGELRWEREIDENLMVPGKFSFELFDGEDEFWELLFEGSLVPYVEKDAKVTLEIKYYGDANYTVEYVGYIDGQEIDYDPLNKKVKFICLPKTDILKNYYLYEPRTDNQGSYQGKNPLSLSYTNVGDVYSADPVNFKTLIHEIFKKINSSCSLTWQHSWLFDSNIQGATDPPPVYKTLDELILTSNHLSALFFSTENPYEIENLYELLMKYAFAFGFICGMITNEKAFVKDIFSYNSGNTQTLGKVKKWKVAYKYGDVEAVRITSRLWVRDSRTGKNAYTQMMARYGLVPSTNDMRGENIIDEEIPIFCYSESGVDYGDLSFVHNTVTYTAGSSRMPKITGGNSLHNMVAEFYYNLRNRKKLIYAGGSNSSIGRVDEFTVEGIKYDYLKDFAYSGNGYQILTLVKRIAKNESNIDALFITDTMDTNVPGEDDAPPKPFANVLPGGYLKDYSYNCEIIPDDINASTTVDLFTMPAGFELKKIIIKINTKFDAITSMKIADDDGDLITWSRINNEDDEVIESFQYKNYATQKTIQAIFTKSGSVTVGDADIILELRTRL